MSEGVNHLLNLFDSLSEPDKQSAASEILRRSPWGEADIPPSQLDGLANELFLSLDAEEAACAWADESHWQNRD